MAKVLWLNHKKGSPTRHFPKTASLEGRKGRQDGLSGLPSTLLSPPVKCPFLFKMAFRKNGEKPFSRHKNGKKLLSPLAKQAQKPFHRW